MIGRFRTAFNIRVSEHGRFRTIIKYEVFQHGRFRTEIKNNLKKATFPSFELNLYQDRYSFELLFKHFLNRYQYLHGHLMKLCIAGY